MGREHAPRVVYHVFSMSFHLFFVFRKGGQRHMGVPCTGVRPCMAVPHKKLHIGILLHHPNGSLCTDCVPQGLLTLWVAYVNTYLLSFNRGDSHAWVGSMPLGLFTMCLAWVSSCFERGDSDTWGFHAQVSAHAWLSPTPWETTLCAPILMGSIVNTYLLFQSRLSNVPHVDGRWVGSMPLGLFTMCLAWVSTCSLCFERGDSDTWGFHAQVSAHAWLSPTRNYTLEVCCTIQMDLYAQIVCPKGCLPYG